MGDASGQTPAQGASLGSSVGPSLGPSAGSTGSPTGGPTLGPVAVLVAGLSGAGRTTVIHALEDLGFEAINNFPLGLVDALLADESATRPLALGIETRTRGFSSAGLSDLLARLRGGERAGRARLLFLDCDDRVLARRFSETRRRHPLAPAEDVETGIARERDLLAGIRAEADILIDTTAMAPHALKAEIADRFAPAGPGSDGLAHDLQPGLAITVSSFSYKRGIPAGADVAIDCRFLRNPYWEETLRGKDGREAAVQAYVTDDPRFQSFFERLDALIAFLLPAYREAGKVYFNIALGCTGGRHRSVTTAEQLAARLRDQGWPTAVRHRELDRAAGRPTTTVSPLEAAQALPAQPRAAGRRNPWHRPADRAGGETG